MCMVDSCTPSILVQGHPKECWLKYSLLSTYQIENTVVKAFKFFSIILAIFGLHAEARSIYVAMRFSSQRFTL